MNTGTRHDVPFDMTTAYLTRGGNLSRKMSCHDVCISKFFDILHGQQDRSVRLFCCKERSEERESLLAIFRGVQIP